ETGTFRVSGGGDEAGNFADIGAVTEIAVGVQGGDPVRGLADRLPDGFGDRDPDGEAGVDPVLTEAADVGQEALGASGRVRPYQDRGAVPVSVRDLREGLIEDGDVVGCGIRPGPAFAEQPGQGFAGAVQETEQRVVAERLL